MKLAYDRVLEFYGVQGKKINNNYVDLIFSKRISQFSLSEREEFLSAYEDIIRLKNKSKYVKHCISYQWIKMAKKKFWKTRRREWLFGSLREGIVAIFNKLSSVAVGFNPSMKVFEWKL